MNKLERRALLGDQQAQKECARQGILLPCPFCKKRAVFIGVHDDEGNYHGKIGSSYERNPWSGLSYALHHKGWGNCILSTDGEYQTMGGMLFNTAQAAAIQWNTRPAPPIGRCKDCANRHSSEFCECRADDAFCSDFEPREG